jgi:hypothetical protein
MRYHITELAGERLDEAARHYDERGFIVIDGVESSVARHFRPLLAERLGVGESSLDALFDASSEPVVLPLETRQRLSRIDSTPELARAILPAVGPVLTRLLGPVLHVSSTFHGQFKGGDAPAVDHGGYGAQYLEVQGQYLIHQDFTGARIPTSPCQLTLWVAQNTSPDWNLRLYPGSHRHGLVCHQWLSLDDPRLAAFGEPVDIQAKIGTVVIFSSLLLHASSNPGPRRRVSCDIRFFPLCGFLPSTPHVLGTQPARVLRDRFAAKEGPTLAAPIRETLAYLGHDVLDASVPKHSILNWANYLHHYVRGEADEARPYMERFVNQEIGVDDPSVYTTKFHNQPIHSATIAHAEGLLGLRSGAGLEARPPALDRSSTALQT